MLFGAIIGRYFEKLQNTCIAWQNAVFLNIRTVGTRHYHLALNYALLQGVYTLWSSKHGVQTDMKIMEPTTCRVHSMLFSDVDRSKNYGEARRTWNVFYFCLKIFLGTFSVHMKFGRVSQRNARRSAISFVYCCLIFTWSV